MSRICNHCKEPIPAEKRSDSLFCSEKCRKAASRKRNNISAKKTDGNKKTLSGLAALPIIEVEQPKTTISRKKTLQTIVIPASPLIAPKEPELNYSMMPELRGYVDDAEKVNQAKLPPPPDPPVEFSETAPVPIEREYKNSTITYNNPEYQRLSKLKEIELAFADQLKNQFNQLVQKLKEVNASVNMTTLQYLGYGAAGGFAGHQIGKPNNEEGGLIAGIISGILFGKLVDWATQEDFKKRKAQAVENLTKQIEEIRFHYSLRGKKVGEINAALQLQEPFFSKQKTDLLNGDAVHKRDIEIENFQKRKAESDQLWEEYYSRIADYESRFGSIDESMTIDVEAEVMPQAQVNDSGIVSSLNLRKVVGGALLFKAAWQTFFGAPSRDFKLVIHGPSFSGKSHLALQFAYYLAVHHGMVLYNTSEEGFSITMDDKLEKLGTRAIGLDIGKYTTVEELKTKVPRTAYNFIILDSVSDMNMSADDLQEVRKHYCCSAIIGVCQNTKGGDIRGGYDLVHDADIKIRVENKIAYTDKNRFIDEQPELEIFNIQPVVVSGKSNETVKQISAAKTETLMPGGNENSISENPEKQNSEPNEDKSNKFKDDDDFLFLDHLI